MCLAIPMRIESISGDMAEVQSAGTGRGVSVALLENPKVGDYVLVHAGFAIKVIDEQQAIETIEILNKFV